MRVKHVTFAGDQIPLTDLVIVVGPNGVGKTTFLSELYTQFVQVTPGGGGAPPGMKWPDLLTSDFLGSTAAEWRNWANGLEKIAGAQQNNEDAYSVGENMSHDARGEYLLASERSNLEIDLENDTALGTLELKYGRKFKGQHSYLASVDNRMFFSNNSGGQLSRRHSQDLRPAPFLALNKGILHAINRSMRLMFDKQLFVEPHNYPTYTIDIGKAGTPGPKKSSSSTEGLLENKKNYEHWFASHGIGSLSSEGHGVRATADLLYILENKRKQVIFIDEPELHLYPATKYTLGKIIASYAGHGKQVILVTHDTELLRGLVYAAADATIIRINADHELKHISSRSVSTSYSADILQAAFQDSVVIVEGISDKHVYSNALAEKHLTDNVALQVVSMEGSDRLPTPIPFYESLQISNAVIADFDTVFEVVRGTKLIVSILDRKKVPKTETSEISPLIDQVVAVLAGKPDKRKGLGCPTATSDDRTVINELLERLKAHGVFIVPIGSLEDWVELPHGTSAEKVLARYKSASNTKYLGLTKFVTDVAQYLLRPVGAEVD